MPQCDGRHRCDRPDLGHESRDVPRKVTAVAAAGFVGLMSLANMAGRIFWASTSDYLGRRNTYMVFFGLGIILYALVPTTGQMGSVALFALAYCIIISMY